MTTEQQEVWVEICIESFKEMLDNTKPEKVKRNKELIEKIMTSTGDYMKRIVIDLQKEKSVKQ